MQSLCGTGVLVLTLASCTSKASDSERLAPEAPTVAYETDPEPPAPQGPRFLVYAVSSIEGERLKELAKAYCKERGATYVDARVFYSHHLEDLPRELGMRDFRTETPPLEANRTTSDEDDRIYFLLECEPLATK
jgi:hypothetical protein